MSENHTPLSKSTPPGTKDLPPVKSDKKLLAIAADDLRIVPMIVRDKTVPTLIFTGDEPDIGQNISFLNANGITYYGQVKEVTKMDGEVLLTFYGPLTYKK